MVVVCIMPVYQIMGKIVTSCLLPPQKKKKWRQYGRPGGQLGKNGGNWRRIGSNLQQNRGRVGWLIVGSYGFSLHVISFSLAEKRWFGRIYVLCLKADALLGRGASDIEIWIVYVLIVRPIDALIVAASRGSKSRLLRLKIIQPVEEYITQHYILPSGVAADMPELNTRRIEGLVTCCQWVMLEYFCLVSP